MEDVLVLITPGLATKRTGVLHQISPEKLLKDLRDSPNTEPYFGFMSCDLAMKKICLERQHRPQYERKKANETQHSVRSRYGNIFFKKGSAKLTRLTY
ncbi:hypothetical protein Y1Q_0014454 [Alligator mississippiensis]|uniref:Uncharacterized protein n=1 Tax=Alligator mississippiensis TaxID=8496 RepID=A0A151PD01_ALLMI|nr:hypothetical protein Y1Q_0014454 [Alligator mississippiensis]